MNTFSRTERIIYEYILCNMHKLSSISAKTIANQTFTTTTSVNRVSKKMGYSGYTELRYKYHIPDTGAEQLHIQETNSNEDDVIELCDQLKRSPHIYLYSVGATLTSLSYLSRFLSIAGIHHLILNDIHQLAMISQGMLLLVSKSGETKAIMEMARNARFKSIKVMAITRKNSSLDLIAARSWHINLISDPSSIYKRETQIDLLSFIDSIGCHLLNTSDA